MSGLLRDLGSRGPSIASRLAAGHPRRPRGRYWLTVENAAPSLSLVEARTEGVIGAPVIEPARIRWARPVRRVARNGPVLAAVVSALAVVFAALFAGRIAPYPPDEQNFDLIESAPGWKAPLGTDRFGRDILSRVIYGSRISLYVAGVSISVA